MSCWVAPSVAAELWGTTVAEVMERIRAGKVPSKVEYGFLVVDVAPGSPQFVRPAPPAPSARPPQTAVAVAPTFSIGVRAAERPNQMDTAWKQARRAVAAARRPPAADRLAAA